MAGANHLCEAQNCGNPTTAFGLKGTVKTRSCDQHVGSLVVKGMTVYSIEGYDFIANPQDGLLFNERKALVEKGLGNLAVQEAKLEGEYAAALQLLKSEQSTLLKTVEVLFSDMQSAVAKRHSEVKQQFASLAEDFNQYTKHRDNVLMPTAELLCAGVKETPLILLTVADLQNQVSGAVNQCWRVSTANIDSLLKPAPQPANIEMAKALYKKASKHYQSKQWKEAEESYLQAKATFEACAPQSIDAATNLHGLGLLYRQTEKWNEAEECHRQAQKIIDSIGPQSDEAANSHNKFGSLYEDAGRPKEAEEHYQQAQRICEAAGRQNASLAYALKRLGYLRQKKAVKPPSVRRQRHQYYEYEDPEPCEGEYFEDYEEDFYEEQEIEDYGGGGADLYEGEDFEDPEDSQY